MTKPPILLDRRCVLVTLAGTAMFASVGPARAETADMEAAIKARP